MAYPRFRVDRKSNPPRVILQCSMPDCSADIKEIKPHDSILVTRAYYCPEHDDGVIELNTPVRGE